MPPSLLGSRALCPWIVRPLALVPRVPPRECGTSEHQQKGVTEMSDALVLALAVVAVLAFFFASMTYFMNGLQE